MIKKIVLGGIRFWQKWLSWDSGIARYLFLSDRACRYSPRCSEYTYQAVEKYGIVRGLFLGMRRVGRCHPWGGGGEDPVPEA